MSVFVLRVIVKIPAGSKVTVPPDSDKSSVLLSPAPSPAVSACISFVALKSPVLVMTVPVTSMPALPVYVVPKSALGTQLVPFHFSTSPVPGAVALTARPCKATTVWLVSLPVKSPAKVTS